MSFRANVTTFEDVDAPNPLKLGLQLMKTFPKKIELFAFVLIILINSQKLTKTSSELSAI